MGIQELNETVRPIDQLSIPLNTYVYNGYPANPYRYNSKYWHAYKALCNRRITNDQFYREFHIKDHRDFIYKTQKHLANTTAYVDGERENNNGLHSWGLKRRGR